MDSAAGPSALPSSSGSPHLPARLSASLPVAVLPPSSIHHLLSPGSLLVFFFLVVVEEIWKWSLLSERTQVDHSHQRRS